MRAKLRLSRRAKNWDTEYNSVEYERWFALREDSLREMREEQAEYLDARERSERQGREEE